MKRTVVQKHSRGCGLACIAFVLEVKYSKIAKFVRQSKKLKDGLTCREIVNILGNFGKSYSYKYLKPRLLKDIYQDNVIVYIKKSRDYPSGHYLVYSDNLWMDPWINFTQSRKISEAKSGWRKSLPGKPIYVLFPS